MSARTILDRYSPGPKWLRYVLSYLSLFLGSILTKINLKGRHHIPDKGPYIVAINHFSMVDPAFVVYALQRPISFLAASDQPIPWYYQWATWCYGFIPTNRVKLAPSTIKKAKKVLQEKEILGIFPEGTTTDKILRPAKRGVIYLSTLNNTRILPVGISGLEYEWNNWLRGVRPKVRIEIGRPFYPLESTKNDISKNEYMDKIGEKIMCRIAALLPENTHGVFKNDDRILQFKKEN
ncbi:MAG: lysophospholipid acyltransferase family protein [Fidelibacterota bacterium]